MKKILIIFSVLLIAGALVTGSIAFFTDSVESNENVVASGSLDIEQHEYQRKWENNGYVQDEEKNFVLQPYPVNLPVYPAPITASSVAENRQDYAMIYVPAEGAGYKGTESLYNGKFPGFIDKIVTVENAGTLICHVRTFVAVPAFDDANGASIQWLHLDLNRAKDADQKELWVWEADPVRAEIDGQAYDIYKGTYQKQLLPGEFTVPALLGFWMDNSVGNDGNNLIYKGDKNYPLLSTTAPWNILVKSEASQAIVFDGAEEALQITFEKDGVPDYHPWLNPDQ